MKSDMKKYFKSIGLFAAILCFIFAVCTAVLLLSPYQGAVATTDSMRPNVPKWSLILAKQVPVEQLATGDIVIFRDPAQGVSIMHRVIQIDASQQKLWTKGDANQEADAYAVSYDLLESKYITHVQWMGWLVFYGQQYSLLIAIIIVTFYLVILISGKMRRSDHVK